MKEIYDELSIKCNKEITSLYSTSFSMAVKMLSPKIQDDIHSIYGFVRIADEIVDSFHDYDKEALFDEFSIDLERALQRKISTNPVLNAFQNVVYKYSIDKELIDAFMLSMRKDLKTQNYDTIEEYEEYIYGSADVVGLMCLKVFVNGDDKMYEKLKEPAQKLGSAFQKVNFLRDFGDDMSQLNRSYFYQLDGRKSLGNETKESIIAEINEDFKEAYMGIKALPIEAKFGVYTAYIYYSKLLTKIAKTNAKEIANKRIRISNPMKFLLLVQSFFNYKMRKI